MSRLSEASSLGDPTTRSTTARPSPPGCRSAVGAERTVTRTPESRCWRRSTAAHSGTTSMVWMPGCPRCDDGRSRVVAPPHRVADSSRVPHIVGPTARPTYRSWRDRGVIVPGAFPVRSMIVGVVAAPTEVANGCARPVSSSGRSGMSERHSRRTARASTEGSRTWSRPPASVCSGDDPVDGVVPIGDVPRRRRRGAP